MAYSKSTIKKLSVVISVYNEERSLESFWRELQNVLNNINFICEIIFVNDGSIDNSQEIIDSILCEENQFLVKSIQLTRSYGHEAAMIAGIDNSNGDLLICMDSDLQHPPNKIPEMIAKNSEGYDVVIMMQNKRFDKRIVKKYLSQLFYNLLNIISEFNFELNGTDFFLISERVVDILKTNYRESNRFLRGYIQIMGFSKASLSFDVNKRSEGESKYSFRNLVKLAITALTSFSKTPLYFGLIIGLIFMIFSIAGGIYTFLNYIFDKSVPSGYTTIVMFLCFCFAVLYIIIGISAIYIGSIYEENQMRPVYIVKSINISKGGNEKYL